MGNNIHRRSRKNGSTVHRKTTGSVIPAKAGIWSLDNLFISNTSRQSFQRKSCTGIYTIIYFK
jgi:hypothetical protein